MRGRFECGKGWLRSLCYHVSLIMSASKPTTRIGICSTHFGGSGKTCFRSKRTGARELCNSIKCLDLPVTRVTSRGCRRWPCWGGPSRRNSPGAVSPSRRSSLATIFRRAASSGNKGRLRNASRNGARVVHVCLYWATDIKLA
jgi:hypothetical protein